MKIIYVLGHQCRKVKTTFYFNTKVHQTCILSLYVLRLKCCPCEYQDICGNLDNKIEHTTENMRVEVNF